MCMLYAFELAPLYIVPSKVVLDEFNIEKLIAPVGVGFDGSIENE